MVGCHSAHIKQPLLFSNYEDELAYLANIQSELSNIRSGILGAQREEEAQRLGNGRRRAKEAYEKRNQFQLKKLAAVQTAQQLKLEEQVKAEQKRLRELLIQPIKDQEAVRACKKKHRKREEGPAAVIATGAGAGLPPGFAAEKKKLLKLYEVKGSGKIGARHNDRSSCGAPAATALELGRVADGRWTAEEQEEVGYMSRVVWTLELIGEGVCWHSATHSTEAQSSDKGKTTSGCWSLASDGAVLLSLGGRCVEYNIEQGIGTKKLVCKKGERRGKVLCPEYKFQPEIKTEQGPLR